MLQNTSSDSPALPTRSPSCAPRWTLSTCWQSSRTTSASSWRVWRTRWWWAGWARSLGLSGSWGYSGSSRWHLIWIMGTSTNINFNVQLVRHFNGLQSLLITLGQVILWYCAPIGQSVAILSCDWSGVQRAGAADVSPVRLRSHVCKVHNIGYVETCMQ